MTEDGIYARMIELKRKHYQYLLALCFNAVLFYLLYVWVQKNIKLHPLLLDIEHANGGSVLFVIFFYLFILVIYGLRFAVLLGENFTKAFSIVGIGSGINNILPFRLGDILRVYFAGQFYGIDMAHTLAATFIERYFDLIILLMFGAIVLFSHQYGLEINSIYLFLVLFSASVLSVFLYRYLIIRDSFLRKLVCRSERIKMLLRAVEDVVSTPNKLPVLIFSVAIWLAVYLLYYLFFKWNLPHDSFGLAGATFLVFTATLSFAIPYSFAGAGVFETAIVYYLIKYLHVVPTKALALALIFHVVTALPQIAVMMVVFIVYRSAWLRSAKKIRPTVVQS